MALFQVPEIQKIFNHGPRYRRYSLKCVLMYECEFIRLSLLLISGHSFPSSGRTNGQRKRQISAPTQTGSIQAPPGKKVPHSIKGYRGHVLLVDFWEYTCINCIRDFRF